jgi:hypothetical protein
MVDRNFEDARKAAKEIGNRIAALNAIIGKLLWMFDAGIKANTCARSGLLDRR